MHSLLAFTVLVVFVALTSSDETKCNSFKDVEMTVQPDRGKEYNTTVNGCIERSVFNETITFAEMKFQKIPRLGVDSVRNMKHLRNVKFYRCQIRVIDPSAFRNVPSLRSIQIVANHIRHVPNGVFSLVPQLEILKFNSNKIELMDNEVFAYVPKLKKVYLDHNLLTSWTKEWFTNSTNLELMDFRFNKIESLSRRAFADLPKLKQIYFDYNELNIIFPEAFEGITNLNYLGLRYNRLKEIGPMVFPNEISIRSMSIDANHLNYICEGVRENLQINEVTISGNPWKCPCLDQLLLWLHETNATVTTSNSCIGSDIPVCSFPLSYSRTCIEEVDDEVTKTYLGELRKIEPPLKEYCARLD